MGLNKLILNFFLHLTNLLTFWVKPVPDTITFISLTSDKLTSDFALIDRQLRKNPRWKIQYDLLVFKKNLWGDFLYFLNCQRQLVEIKRSELAILNDNNYVISRMKPKYTKVLQVWHACGAVKKFGNQIRRQYPVRNYDAILSSSEVWKEPFGQAFGIDPNKVYVTGNPRLDNLKNEKKSSRNLQRFYKKYPQLKGKKILLYAPTFRGNIVDGLWAVPFDGGKVADALPDDWVVLCKYHPLLASQVEEHLRVYNVSKEELYTLMHASDALVSDYSSVIFDYSLLGKPMISYVPDLEEYEQTIGLNMPYRQDFPGAIVRNEEDLVKAVLDLDQYDYEKLNQFEKKYMQYNDSDNTKRTISLIEDLIGHEPAQ